MAEGAKVMLWRNFIVITENKPTIPENIQLRKKTLYKSDNNFILHLNTIKPTQIKGVQRFFPDALEVTVIPENEIINFRHLPLVNDYKDKGIDITSVREVMRRSDVEFQRKIKLGKIVHDLFLNENFPEQSFKS